jgi:hypothetical protein
MSGKAESKKCPACGDARHPWHFFCLPCFEVLPLALKSRLASREVCRVSSFTDARGFLRRRSKAAQAEAKKSLMERVKKLREEKGKS